MNTSKKAIIGGGVFTQKQQRPAKKRQAPPRCDSLGF
jgi:hypothetical protein